VATGAARGIGRATAIAFAREGAEVVGVDICVQVDPRSGVTPSTPEDLEETGKIVGAAGHRWLERALSRLKAREPFLTEGFSPVLSNAALRQAFTIERGSPLSEWQYRWFSSTRPATDEMSTRSSRIDRGRLCPQALGLSLEEAKAITGGIQ
jgi:NAD(P)-dependent dehydrogenase (short-subunit alcohol dehydrogenase family)